LRATGQQTQERVSQGRTGITNEIKEKTADIA
jgi:hypothetical protein